MKDLYDQIFKVILIGDWGVGKSSILHRVINDEFPSHSSTVGIEFMQKVIDLHKKKLILQVWDTAGQDRFNSITSTYYRSAVGALLVYDVTNRESFASLDTWIEELKSKTSENIVLMILGNKIDLGTARTVTFDEGFDYAKANSCLFSEVSALYNIGISDCVDEMIWKIFEEGNRRVETKRSTSKLSYLDETEDEWNLERCRKKFCC
jgi:small GTP-binding protein